MNIRTKMISLLALLFAVLIVLEISIQKQVLMPSFAELEREDAQTSMKRIDYALDATLESIESMTGDWGNWADAYQFVKSPNVEFVNTNVTAASMKQLKVNAMLIVDLNGAYLLSSARTWETGETLDLDFTARKALPEDFPWRKNLADGKSARGLLRTNRGVMMTVAAPVLNGSGSGQHMGMVIMGRLLGWSRRRRASSSSRRSAASTDPSTTTGRPRRPC
jgi:sensor domain CHASE-containing protein